MTSHQSYHKQFSWKGYGVCHILRRQYLSSQTLFQGADKNSGQVSFLVHFIQSSTAASLRQVMNNLYGQYIYAKKTLSGMFMEFSSNFMAYNIGSSSTIVTFDRLNAHLQFAGILSIDHVVYSKGH